MDEFINELLKELKNPMLFMIFTYLNIHQIPAAMITNLEMKVDRPSL